VFASRLALGGAVVGLAAVSTEATGWLGRAEVTSVKTQDLADAFLKLGTSTKAPQAAIDAVSSASDKWYGKVQSSQDVMRQFAGLAQGAFSMSWDNIIGRAQSGTERVDRFNQTAGQMDAALAQLVHDGHGVQAAQQFDALKRATGLTGAELQHVINHFPQYTAAAAARGPSVRRHRRRDRRRERRAPRRAARREHRNGRAPQRVACLRCRYGRGEESQGRDEGRARRDVSGERRRPDPAGGGP
jgi:hypothetical protein